MNETQRVLGKIGSRLVACSPIILVLAVVAIPILAVAIVQIVTGRDGESVGQVAEAFVDSWLRGILIAAVLLGAALQLGVMWWEGAPRRRRRRAARAQLMTPPSQGTRHQVHIRTFPKFHSYGRAAAAVSVGDKEVIGWCKGWTESSAERRAYKWCDRHLNRSYIAITAIRHQDDG